MCLGEKTDLACDWKQSLNVFFEPFRCLFRAAPYNPGGVSLSPAVRGSLEQLWLCGAMPSAQRRARYNSGSSLNVQSWNELPQEKKKKKTMAAFLYILLQTVPFGLAFPKVSQGYACTRAHTREVQSSNPPVCPFLSGGNETKNV